jgi:hypothetical protein
VKSLVDVLESEFPSVDKVSLVKCIQDAMVKDVTHHHKRTTQWKGMLIRKDVPAFTWHTSVGVKGSSKGCTIFGITQHDGRLVLVSLAHHDDRSKKGGHTGYIIDYSDESIFGKMPKQFLMPARH